MKKIVAMIAMIASSPALGKEYCERNAAGKVVCQNVDVDAGKQHQEDYDGSMKSAGKWDLISDSLFLMTVVSIGGTYYSLNKAQTFDALAKQRDLTPQELKDQKKWNAYASDGVGATAGCLVFGLITYGVQIHYENKAHNFALEVGTSW